MKQHKSFVYLSAISLLVCILVYSNHFNNDFHFDDFHTINDNPHIRELKNIPRFFTDPGTTSVLPSHQSYRPGLTALNAIDYAIYSKWKQLFPESTIKLQYTFHISIFLLYLIQGVFMFLLFLKLFNLTLKHQWNKYIAFFGTAVYMLHTANAETINYIIQRADSFSTAMVVISLYLFIERPRLRKFGIYLIPYIIGMLVKEPAVMFVPILMVYLLLYEHHPKYSSVKDIISKQNLGLYLKVFKGILPGLVLGALFLYLSLVALRPETWTGSVFHWWDYLKTQPWVILRYFISFFLPLNLSADTDWGIISNIFDERTIIGLACIISSFYLIIKNLTNKVFYPAIFGMLWFYFALLPTSSIISLAEVTNDHRMFFPFVGLALTFSWLPAYWLIKKENTILSNLKYQNLIVLLSVLIPLSFAYGAWQRNKVWDNSEALWYDVSVKSPRNGRGLMNYGLTLMNKGDYTGALDYYNRALIQSPYYAYLHINMALCKTKLGYASTEIEDHYKKALQYAPEYYGGYHYYGSWLWSQMRIPEAINNLRTAITKAPAVLFSRSVLMQLYAAQQMYPDLNSLAKETLSSFPGNEEALKYLSQSENKEFTKDEAYYINLGLTLYNGQQYTEAITVWEDALKINPNSALTHNNIGSAYNAMKEYKKAIPWLEKALKIDPGFTLAANNLKLAKENVK